MITVNLFYKGKNGSSRAFAEEIDVIRYEKSTL